MAARNISLTDVLDRFVTENVESGSCQNASEVIRAGLRLLQGEEELRAPRIAAFNAAVQIGLDQLDRGEGLEIEDDEAYFDQLEAEIDAEFAAEEAKAAAK